jgi:uncharacterized repeat protein (TIGR03803 family)
MKAGFIALLAGMVGCASVQPISAADAVTFKEKVLYSFCSQENCTDGAIPAASLIDVDGLLYGTTESGGGIYDTAICNSGCGTVFSVDPSARIEKVLYAFCEQPKCADGAYPAANTIAVNGLLYGTTDGGGSYDKGICKSGCGTVFSLDLKLGAEKVLHSFCSQPNCADGYLSTSLIDVNGILYGTTLVGGETGCGGYGCGTAFSIDLNTGAEKVLHSFCSQPKCTDGQWPLASLIDVNGMLYGTTEYGGEQGLGTVFALDPMTGAETVLYSFCSQQNCTDGYLPAAGLTAVNGTLYGTTPGGGTYNAGTVFALDPNTGVEKVLYSFCQAGYPCTDGEDPVASLIDVKGTLYGTTEYGGGGGGGGTVFEISPDGTETVLYSFCRQQNCADGQWPVASLIDVNGKLYGTTYEGGAGCPVYSGCGTVFMLKKKRLITTTHKFPFLFGPVRSNSLRLDRSLDRAASRISSPRSNVSTPVDGGKRCSAPHDFSL